MALGKLVYGGIESDDYGVYVLDATVDNGVSRDVSYITIPGRSGSLAIDNGRFENGSVSYRCAIVEDAKDSYHDYVAALSSLVGYQRLEDEIYDDYFRMAIFQPQMEPRMFDDRNKSIFSLSFNCKPQKYLKSGEQETTLSQDGTLTNPTQFDSKPLLRIYGKGSVMIGSHTITVLQSFTHSYIDVDCEMMDAFYGSTNCNQYISVEGNEFPALHPGDNGVDLGTGVTQVKIKPRWWTV